MTVAKKAAAKPAAKKAAEPKPERTVPNENEARAAKATDVSKDNTKFNPEVTKEINELDEGTSFEYKGFIDGRNVSIGTRPTRDQAEEALEAEVASQLRAHEVDWMRQYDPDRYQRELLQEQTRTI